MGRVSQLAVRGAELALEDAGLLGSPLLHDGQAGVACGSSIGSTPDIMDFALMMINGTSEGLSANSYVRMMPHTAAANIGIFFGLKGRLIPTSSACTSASQAIGFAYETIPNKPIVAGRTKGPDVVTVQPDTTSGTLGRLALGRK